MSDKLEPLILDLVAWCAVADRTYDEVIEAWRTSCPRLMVWEEAHARGFVETRPGAGGLMVVVTPAGLALAAGDIVRRRRLVPPPVAALPR